MHDFALCVIAPKLQNKYKPSVSQRMEDNVNLIKLWNESNRKSRRTTCSKTM